MRRQFQSSTNHSAVNADLAAALDLAVALEWSQSVGGEAGDSYADAVQWCLRAPSVSTKDDKWREDLFANVVAPLQYCYEQLSSKSSWIEAPWGSFFVGATHAREPLASHNQDHSAGWHTTFQWVIQSQQIQRVGLLPRWCAFQSSGLYIEDSARYSSRRIFETILLRRKSNGSQAVLRWHTNKSTYLCFPETPWGFPMWLDLWRLRVCLFWPKNGKPQSKSLLLQEDRKQEQMKPNRTDPSRTSYTNFRTLCHSYNVFLDDLWIVSFDVRTMVIVFTKI